MQLAPQWYPFRRERTIAWPYRWGRWHRWRAGSRIFDPQSRRASRFLGLLDTHLALILVNATFIMPFVVVILRQAFLDLPVELEESALIDGAGHWGAFWRIALPLVAPAIAATALIIFGRAWNEFLFALAISAQGAPTVPVHMAGTAGTRVQFWYLAVRQMIAIVPPMLIALLAQRSIVRGLTLGAVKG